MNLSFDELFGTLKKPPKRDERPWDFAKQLRTAADKLQKIGKKK